jgi:hypothetical protein
MADENDLYVSVVEFISRTASVRREKIHADTRIWRDLGIDGDDAEEFMTKFAQEFGVDLSAFKFNRYFGPEAGFNPLLWPFYKLAGKLPIVDIHVRDLVQAAREGKWIID